MCEEGKSFFEAIGLSIIEGIHTNMVTKLPSESRDADYVDLRLKSEAAYTLNWLVMFPSINTPTSFPVILTPKPSASVPQR